MGKLLLNGYRENNFVCVNTLGAVLFILKKPPSLKMVMVKWFYQKKRNICYDKIWPNGKNYLIPSINVNIISSGVQSTDTEY